MTAASVFGLPDAALYLRSCVNPFAILYILHQNGQHVPAADKVCLISTVLTTTFVCQVFGKLKGSAVKAYADIFKVEVPALQVGVFFFQGSSFSRFCLVHPRTCKIFARNSLLENATIPPLSTDLGTHYGELLPCLLICSRFIWKKDPKA